MCRAPARQRRRPLARAPQIENLLAALEDAAVDIARQDGPYLAGNDRNHRFVEQGHTLGDSSKADECSTASVTRQRQQTAVAKSMSDARCLLERCVPAFGVASHQELYRRRDQQVPADYAVELPLVEKPFGPCEPAGGWRHGAAVGESEADPERRPCGRFVFTARQERLVRARHRALALIVTPEQVSG